MKVVFTGELDLKNLSTRDTLANAADIPTAAATSSVNAGTTTKAYLGVVKLLHLTVTFVNWAEPGRKIEAPLDNFGPSSWWTIESVGTTLCALLNA